MLRAPVGPDRSGRFHSVACDGVPRLGSCTDSLKPATAKVVRDECRWDSQMARVGGERMSQTAVDTPVENVNNGQSATLSEVERAGTATWTCL